MAGIHDQERIDELRKRLYARGQKPETREPYRIPQTPVEKPVPTTWQRPSQPKKPSVEPMSKVAPDIAPPVTPPVEPVVPAATPATPTTPVASSGILDEGMVRKKRKRGYRIKVVLAALGFFIVAMVISSLLLMKGGNTISGENIAITVTGPFTVGGGETLPLQIGVSNANSVPIQSAMLIVEYPQGAQAVGEGGGILTVERLPLETINAGETLNIPLRAIVFGEENSEKVVAVSIEYRVEGSNATFFKEAEPLRFKISSSPVVLRLESNTKISSGQPTNIKLTVTSNAPTPLSNVLIKAEYPVGFDFVRANPEPVSNNNAWVIDTLDPEESFTIELEAIVVGKETDELAAHFSVGVPRDQDPYSFASVFSTDSVEFEIEQPFLDVTFEVGDSTNGTAVVSAGQPVSMAIAFENTLNDTLYDAVISVELTGNAVEDMLVGPPNGFYDSSRKTIVWDVSTVPGLDTILPGDEERLTFTLTPDTTVSRTPQVDMTVSIKARRVSETRVPEELIGTAEGTIRVATSPQLLSETRYTVGEFTGSGPVPPVAEETTIYTLSMQVQNGTNKLSDVEVTTSLPNYVNWLNESGGDGTVTFNPTARTLTWKVSEVAADGRAQISFQVALLPSQSQIATTPTLMGEQRLKATDQFTGSTVRATRSAVTTELSTEAGYQPGNGRVQAP